MSRTDRHRPYRVQLADPTERNRYGYSSGHQYVEVLAHNSCGCWSCTDPFAWEGGQRAVNKRTRRGARRDITEHLEAS